MPLTTDDHLPDSANRKMVLPTLQSLRKLSSHNLALRRVTMLLDCSEIPQETPPLSNHGLRCLFIEPSNSGVPTANALELTQLVTLARYLDHLFPNIRFLTPHDEFKASGQQTTNVLQRVRNFQEGSLEMWKNVDYLLKSYQMTREAAVGRA